MESKEVVLEYSIYPYRGECLTKLEKYNEAIQNYTEAIKIFPNNSSFYYQRALIFDSSIPEIENYHKAINDYNKAIELTSNNANYYANRALLNYDFQKYSDVIEDLDKTIAIDSNHTMSYLVLSSCYFKNGDEIKSFKYLKMFKKLFDAEEKKEKINIQKLMITSDLIESSVEFFMKVLEILLDLKKYYKLDYHTFSKVLDDSFIIRNNDFVVKLEKKWHNIPDSLNMRFYQIINELFVFEQGEFSEARKHLFYIKLKLFILEDIFEYFEKYLANYRGNLTKTIIKEIASITYFYFEISKSLQNKSQNYLLKIENEKAEAKIEERNRIIRSQAHNIKNILRSVINPLTYLKRTINNPRIEEALKHAGIIREMVNATSLSYTGSTDDFFHDAKKNENGISIREMITTSLETSIGNIVEDIKYYSNFWEQYFPDNKVSDKASDEYRLLHNIPQNERYTKLENFICKNMFNIEVKFGKSESFIMGNQKSSGVKMLTLINELIFNAVKYVAFVEKEKRFLSLTFSNNNQQIIFKIENSYKNYWHGQFNY
ncbi:tetratricopeptide repeat protein [Calditrichota bacterium]